MSAPVDLLVGDGGAALGAALHGLLAFLLLVVATVGLYLAFRLFAGRIRAFPDLQLATTVMAVLSFVTIVTGNSIYPAYRAKVPDSPRSYFLANMPAVHQVFFEFKEYIALFTLPLSVTAAFLVWRYGRSLLDRPPLRVAVSLLIFLTFACFTIAFGLGAAVTKLKSI